LPVWLLHSGRLPLAAPVQSSPVVGCWLPGLCLSAWLVTAPLATASGGPYRGLRRCASWSVKALATFPMPEAAPVRPCAFDTHFRFSEVMCCLSFLCFFPVRSCSWLPAGPPAPPDAPLRRLVLLRRRMRHCASWSLMALALFPVLRSRPRAATCGCWAGLLYFCRFSLCFYSLFPPFRSTCTCCAAACTLWSFDFLCVFLLMLSSCFVAVPCLFLPVNWGEPCGGCVYLLYIPVVMTLYMCVFVYEAYVHVYGLDVYSIPRSF